MEDVTAQPGILIYLQSLRIRRRMLRNDLPNARRHTGTSTGTRATYLSCLRTHNSATCRSVYASASHQTNLATPACTFLGAREHSRRKSRSKVVSSAAGATASSSWAIPPVVVVGAGIAGLATAVALNKVGVPVIVLEQGDEKLRAEGSAIGLWENAWVALDALGVADTLRPRFLRLNRVELCRSNGNLLRGFGFSETEAGARAPRSAKSTLPGPASSSSTNIAVDASGAGSEFRGVRRSDLIQALAAALPAGTIRARSQVTKVLPSQGPGRWPAAVLSDGSQIEGSVVIGADGVKSVVAGSSGLALPMPNYSGYTAHRGVAHLPGGLESIGLPANTIRQIWGQGVRAGLYPLDHNHVYWFTCFNSPADAPVPSTPEAVQQDALKQVEGWSWGLQTAIRNTPPDAISRSRIVDRWTKGSIGSGTITVVGDAAHPMTPNLGQGGCVSLEDAVELANTIVSVASRSPATAVTPDALAAALREFETKRVSRCLPLTVRSYVMGALLQLPYDPVCLVRDWFVSTLFPPSHFLDHTTYNCGTLTSTKL